EGPCRRRNISEAIEEDARVCRMRGFRASRTQRMEHFERVRQEFGDLPYMQHRHATFLRDLIVKHDVRDILETGFYQGKSSAYFAAILEDLGRGHLTTIDLPKALERTPNIDYVLSK